MRTIPLLLPALLLCVVALATGVALAAPTVVDGVVWGTPEAPSEAAPGDVGRTITILVQNTDDETYTGVRGTIAAGGGLSPVKGAETATLDGDFAPGDVWEARFLVNLADSTPVDKSGSLPFTLVWEDPSGGDTDDSFDYLPFRPTGRATLVLESTNASIAAGERATYVLKVSNTGNGPAGNVAVTFLPADSDGLTIVGRDNTFRVGTLAAGATSTLQLPLLAPAQPTPAAVALRLSYVDAAGATVTESRSLALRVVDAPPGPLTFTVDPGALEQGRAAPIALRVANTGATDVFSVTLALDLSQAAGALAPTDGIATAHFNGIPGGEDADATFHLLAAADAPELVPLVVRATWVGADLVPHTRVAGITVRVAPSSAGELAVTLASNEVPAGRAGQLSFELRNLGELALRDVRVAAGLPGGATPPITILNASDMKNLGDIEPDRAKRVVVDVLARKDAQDVHPITLTVSWREDGGASRSRDYRFGVAVLGTVDVRLTQGVATLLGGAADARGTLTNLGNAPAYNAYLRAVEQDGYAESEAQFLGDLDPNAALPFTLVAPLGGESRGDGSTLVLALTWNDDYGNVRERTYEMRVAGAPDGDDGGEDGGPTGEAPGNDTPGPGLALALGAVGAAALAWRRRR